MKAIDIFLRVAMTAVFLALIFIPESKSTMAAVLALFFALGLWGVIYPPGLLGWAKSAHREIDLMDRRGWAVVRLIGSGFMIFSFLWLVMLLRKV